MHMVGASKTDADLVLHYHLLVARQDLDIEGLLASSASNSAISNRISLSHVAPRLTPEGRNAAGTPSPNISPRAPEGPSDICVNDRPALVSQNNTAFVIFHSLSEKEFPVARCWLSSIEICPQ